MVSTAPAPKPPSASAKGSPSRPCSASLPQTALLQPPFSFMYFLRASKSYESVRRPSTLSLRSRCSSDKSKSILVPCLETPCALSIHRHFSDAQLRIVDAPLGAGPESILTIVVMDSGLVASLRPGMTAEVAASQPQHSLGDDVALDLVGAAVDRDLAA